MPHPARRLLTQRSRPSSAAQVPAPDPAAAAMLRIADLKVAIGPVPIIRGASLALEAGEMCGLIGRNGAGKTTLLRAVMGAIPATGSVMLGDVDLLARPPHVRAGLGIGYMPEDRRLVPAFTVEQNILLPSWTTAA